MMKIGGRIFENRTYIMGILNVTPDSFSDGGAHIGIDNALKYTEKMIKDGADIVDVGGESTRPGYTRITEEEEIQRTVPVIEAIKKNFDIPLSIDTYKPNVARAAFEAGADMLNDIWGFKDKSLADITAEYKKACCIAHNSEKYCKGDIIGEIAAALSRSVDTAQKAGIDSDSIIIDPGIGFGKTYEQNLEAINRLNELHALGLPILLGASRKSVIGLTLDLPADERTEGTLATTVIAVMKGCLFVRVHDVKENKRAVLMTEKILGKY